MLKENFMVLNTLKKGRSQVNNPGIHVKKLEKEQNKPKDRRKKKKAEIKSNVANVGPNISTSILNVIYGVLQIKD